jgi:hypothetical protein
LFDQIKDNLGLIINELELWTIVIH